MLRFILIILLGTFDKSVNFLAYLGAKYNSWELIRLALHVGVCKEQSMMFIVAEGRYILLQRLIQMRVNVNAQSEGFTALYYSLFNIYSLNNPTETKKIRFHSGHVECARLLLESGACPNVAANNGNPFGAAILSNNVALVDLFLKKGAHPNAMLFNHTYPILLAAANGNVNIINILLSYGAKADAVDKAGYTFHDLLRMSCKEDELKGHNVDKIAF